MTSRLFKPPSIEHEAAKHCAYWVAQGFGSVRFLKGQISSMAHCFLLTGGVHSNYRVDFSHVFRMSLKSRLICSHGFLHIFKFILKSSQVRLDYKVGFDYKVG